MTRNLTSRNLNRTIRIIALPIALQNLVTVSVSMADTLMLGTLGEVTLSSSSLANQLFFIFTLIIYGTAGGTNVLLSQFWGKKDTMHMRKTLAYTYRVIFAVSFLMMVLALLCPSIVMHVFTNDESVIEQGVQYLQIVGISYIFFGISTVTSNILRSVHEVRIGMYASVVSLCVNVFFNWVFIFGNLGVSAMGIKGAAIATTIARIVEFCIIMVYMKFYENCIKLHVRDLLHLDQKLCPLFFKNSVPVICNEMLWSIGFSLLSVIIGHMGTAMTAAYSIYNVISQLSSVMSQGIAAAAAVIVGNAIGAGKRKELQTIVWQLRKVAIGVGAFACLFVLGIRPLIPILYDIGEEVITILMQILLVGALLEGLRPSAFVNMVGILRGGGDVKFVLVNDVIYLWTICISFGYIAAFYLHFPVWLVFFILRIDDVIHLIVSTWRVAHWKWVKDVTKESVAGGMQPEDKNTLL